MRFGGWGSQKETETQGFDGLGYLKVGDFGGFWSWGFGVVLRLGAGPRSEVRGLGFAKILEGWGLWGFWSWGFGVALVWVGLGAGPMGLGAGPRSEVRGLGCAKETETQGLDGWGHFEGWGLWGPIWGLLELGFWGGAGWGLGLGQWGFGLAKN